MKPLIEYLEGEVIDADIKKEKEPASKRLISPDL